MTPDFWRNKNVFLTGHAGFKGAWMCAILNHLGAKVTGYSLPAPTTPSLFDLLGIAKTITHIEGDICNRAHFIASVEEANPDIIIHLAAQSLVRKSYADPITTFDTNLTGTMNLLEAARGCKNLTSVLVITTDKCYRNDETGRFFIETDPLGGKDPYSASKACAEILTQSYADSFYKDSGVIIATARAGNVIGGGDWAEDRLIPDVVRAIGRGESVLIRNPLATRPWQHVLEPLFGYLTLIESGQGGAWNFGPAPDSIQPVGDVLKQLQQSLSFNIQLDTATHPHEAKTLGLDITKAKTQLGWMPKLSLSEALQWTGEWYQTYRNGGDIAAVTAAQINAYRGRG